MMLASLLAFSCKEKLSVAGDWKIDTVGGEKVTTLEKEAFLSFDENENRVHGCLGVNTVNGAYTVDGNKISIGELAMTMMAGLPQDMDTENKLRNALISVTSVKAKGAGKLILMDDSGAAVMTLVRK